MKNGLKIYRKEIFNIKINNYYLKIEETVKSFRFSVIFNYYKRPWGDFLVLDESQG
jgi:hypothetical protein